MARLHLTGTLTHYRWDRCSQRLIAELSWINAETWRILDKMGLLHTCTATVLGVRALVLAARGCEGGLCEKNPGPAPTLGRQFQIVPKLRHHMMHS